MNEQPSNKPIAILVILVAVLMVGGGFLAAEYVAQRAALKDLTYKYRVLATTDVASIAPSDFQLLLMAPPELMEDVMKSISVVRGQVAEVSADSITLDAKIVDVEKVKDVLSGKEEFSLLKKPRQETIKRMSIGLTEQTKYLIEGTQARVGDQITIVTFEPVLFSETLTAKYIFPVIPGLTN